MIKSNDADKNWSARQKWLWTHRIPLLVQSIKDREGLTVDPEQAFECLCAADPSQNYSAVQWLMDTYARKGFLWEDVKDGKNSKVYNTLSLFGKYRKNLDANSRNLYNCKTLSQVYKLIQSYSSKELAQDQDNSSIREQKKKYKQEIFSQTCFLYKGEELTVAIPLTKESAQWWGRGTQWCTASVQSKNYFDDYNRDAPLIILMFEDNSGNHRKLQLWVTKDEFQWMDETDEMIIWDFAHDHWKQLKQVIMWLVEVNSDLIVYVPDHAKTVEMCLGALKNAQKSENMNKNLFSHVPRNLYSQEIFLQAMRLNGSNFKNIPKDQQTKQICLEAIKNTNNFTVSSVAQHLLDNEVCQAIVNAHPHEILSIPLKYCTDNLYRTALENYSLFLYRDKRVLNKELYDFAIEQNATNLKDIPENFIDAQMCLNACKQNGWALQWVPDRFKTQDLVQIACEHNFNAFFYVPEKLKTPELCQLVCENNGEFLSQVPEHLRTQELCWLSVEQTGFAISHVPQQFLDQEICTKSV